MQAIKFDREVYDQLQLKRKFGRLSTLETALLHEMCKDKLFEMMQEPEVKAVFERLKYR